MNKAVRPGRGDTRAQKNRKLEVLEQVMFSDVFSMNETPLVSIVIPVYNVSRYLPQCLESVIHQTWKHIEIIVIDDGSTDDSGRICDQYALRDGRIRVLHTENKGIASVRNLGLKNVRGAYLQFIDSDDWMEPHTIETLLKTAMAYHADFVAAEKYDEYQGLTIPPEKAAEDCLVFQGESILDAFAEDVFGNIMNNKLFKIGCYEGITFPEGRIFEDIATLWKLLMNLVERDGIIVALSEPLFHFRKRKSSITHTHTFSTIVDRWLSYRERYESMPGFQKQMLKGCFSPIGRMWLYYGSFSKDEKVKAKAVIREMNSFSRAHFHQVMKGDYPWRIKCVCLISQFKAPPFLWLCFLAAKLIKRFVSKNDKLFD